MKWTLVTEEKTIENPNIEEIEDILALIKNYELEYMVFKPSEKISNCNFMQLVLDEDDLFNIEVSLKYEHGTGSMIYSKEGYDIDETKDILVKFMEENIIPNVEDWEIVGRFE